MSTDKDYEFFASFADELQQIMQKEDKEKLSAFMSQFADCSIISFENIEQVENSDDLDLIEKSYCLKALNAGTKKVWMLADIVGWEH